MQRRVLGKQSTNGRLEGWGGVQEQSSLHLSPRLLEK